jgi:hypothetical protein
VRLFKKSKAFLKHSKRNGGFSSNVRHFKDIFRELEAFNYKCEAFIKITRLSEDIFRRMEASIRILRLFKYIF